MNDKNVASKLRALEIIARKITVSSIAGDYSSAFKGAGLDFDQLREYQPGDDVRMIDWNASARTDQVMIKQFVQERDKTILACLDVSSSMLFGSGLYTKRDVANNLVTALSTISLLAQDKFGLLFFADGVESVIAPGKGAAHHARALKRLSDYAHKPAAKTSLETVAKDIIERKLARRGSILFFITDGIDVSLEQSRSFARLCAEYEVVVFFVHDALEQALPSFGYVRTHDPESGAEQWINSRDARWQRIDDYFEQLAKRLTAKKADSARFACDDSWINALVNFFHKRIRRQI